MKGDSLKHTDGFEKHIGAMHAIYSEISDEVALFLTSNALSSPRNTMLSYFAASNAALIASQDDFASPKSIFVFLFGCDG